MYVSSSVSKMAIMLRFYLAFAIVSLATAVAMEGPCENVSFHARYTLFAPLNGEKYCLNVGGEEVPCRVACEEARLIKEAEKISREKGKLEKEYHVFQYNIQSLWKRISI